MLLQAEEGTLSPSVSSPTILYHLDSSTGASCLAAEYFMGTGDIVLSSPQWVIGVLRC